MGRINPATDQDAERKVALLANLPHRDLANRWQTLNGGPAPKGISRRLLVLALAYRMQADTYGNMDSRTNRYLRAIASGTPDAPPPRVSAASTLKPGMRLMREWNGRTHIVDVINDGFRWNGQIHASLSAVARAITGARWSGPRFFGLLS
ncbi:MAG: DUF2924 domain-containing protein [Alphaproteobacteria bacterium]|nr:DUF2924 domain-containing protein [Alphaproteobacteria bacterium]